MWTPHFLAVQGRHDGQSVTLTCIYGLTATKARERLFDTLARQPPPTGTTVLGGDFNCTQEAELDKSRTTKKNYNSPVLTRWLLAWDLLDATVADAIDAKAASEITEFRLKHHSFHYGYGDGKSASCRLDRFYLDRASLGRVIGVTAMEPVMHVDR